jgi:hypothetical protein
MWSEAQNLFKLRRPLADQSPAAHLTFRDRELRAMWRAKLFSIAWDMQFTYTAKFLGYLS